MKRVYLLNLQSLGTACGWGEGRTHDEAKADALRQAREIDPNAYYEGGHVNFRQDVRL